MDDATNCTSLRWAFFEAAPEKDELTVPYLERLGKLAALCQFNEFTMKDALLYNLLRYKMSTEDRKEIFDSYLDYDQVVKISQSVDGAIFENYIGGMLEIKEEMLAIEEDEETEMNMDENLEIGGFQNNIEPSLPKTNVKNEEPKEDPFDHKLMSSYHPKKEKYILPLIPEGNVVYSCDHCDLKYPNKKCLHKHIFSAHGGASYSCGHCDFETTEISSLNKHIGSVHKLFEKQIPSDQSELKANEESNHEKILFPCQQCDKVY